MRRMRCWSRENRLFLISGDKVSGFDEQDVNDRSWGVVDDTGE